MNTVNLSVGQKMVLEYLKGSGPATAGQIGRGLGCSEKKANDWARGVLFRLLDRGLVIRHADGYFELALGNPSQSQATDVACTPSFAKGELS